MATSSVSNRGLRCLLFVGCAIFVAACGSGATFDETQEHPVLVSCEVPWNSMDQVSACADQSRYRVAETEGEQTVHIVVRDEDPDVIAASLADAWLEQVPGDVEGVVWAWSKRGAIGHGYDRGVLSEQGVLGETLVFQICSEWEPFPGPSDICTDFIEFEIEQE